MRASLRRLLTGLVAGVVASSPACSGEPQLRGAAEHAEGSDTPDPPRRPPAQFMTGDECLFCHREKIAVRWGDNHHNRTLHDVAGVTGSAGNEPPAGAELALGAREPQHWLKSTEQYGKLAVHTVGDTWDAEVFGAKCAGCHASGVDSSTGAFVAVSLDCFVCHGDVALEHTNDPASVHLSPRREEDPAVVVAICGQCHLRGGRSRGTGRPWPKDFVAGDRLLEDYAFDFSEEALAKLSLADRHVAENVRDVAVTGTTEVTCVSCHSVHGESTRTHRKLEESERCFTCHIDGEDRSERLPLTRGSSVCAL